MSGLPSTQGGEGYDLPAGASIPAAEAAVTSPIESVAKAQRGFSPPMATSTVRSGDGEQGAPSNPDSRNRTFDRNCQWTCGLWAFLNTCDHNCPWTCGVWALLLVFIVFGIVYLLNIGHKFR